MIANSLANHLWQSTLVAGLAWLVTLTLRHERAGVRYGVWLVASLKFLTPFAWLTSLGERAGWHPVAVVVASQPYTFVLGTIGEPFSRPGAAARVHESLTAMLPYLATAIWIAGLLTVLTTWIVRWRRVSAIVRTSAPITSGAIVEIVRQLERAAGITRPVAVVRSDSSLEPGVFGLLTSTLIWPAHIESHLAPEQISAIAAHEVTHVRRRDNLAAAVHMAVQAVFWFHPMVWWMGSRLVDERERACDEDVIVLLGHDRRVYAESILKTCQFSVESPLACMAGVTGANLKKRIEHIMTNEGRRVLSAWKKGVIGTAAALAIAVPFVTGALTVRPVFAQQRTDAPAAAFDVTSVKPNDSGSGMIQMMPAANGGFQATNVTLGMLVRMVFQIQDHQIIGGPKWLFADRFDIKGTGTAPGKEGPPLEKMKSLVIDRFHLVMHFETREMPMYALVLARRDGKLGDSLTRSTADCTAEAAAARGRSQAPPPPPPPPLPGQAPRCGFGIGLGTLMIGGQTMATIATNLSRLVGAVVVDRTKLQGAYDLKLTYAPDPGLSGRGDLPPQLNGAPPPPAVMDRPSIFAAVQEQLGLRLESTKGPVDVLVIDGAEKPTAD